MALALSSCADAHGLLCNELLGSVGAAAEVAMLSGALKVDWVSYVVWL